MRPLNFDILKAVIFDMDGVIVDSEPFWQQAEEEVFTALGVKVTEELGKLTQKMTTREVTQFWFAQNRWEGVSMEEAEQRVVDQVIALIQAEDCIIPGVCDTVKKLKQAGIKTGLATNSPYRIIPEVLAKAGLRNSFEVIVSAEFVTAGKPAPDVYLSAISQLKVVANQALAIEDSNSGIRAARSAGLKAIGYGKAPLPNADFQIASYNELVLI